MSSNSTFRGFMGNIFVVLVGVLVLVSLVTGEYVFGRIVLPEMGLTSPGWWTYFWGDLFFLVFLSPLYFILAVAKS